MKQKEIKGLHQKNSDELKQQLKKVTQELVKLEMEKHVGKLKNIHLIAQKKHEIAVLKTILREKELNL